jgi:hypothetical protein
VDHTEVTTLGFYEPERKRKKVRNKVKRREERKAMVAERGACINSKGSNSTLG